MKLYRNEPTGVGKTLPVIDYPNFAVEEIVVTEFGFGVFLRRVGTTLEINEGDGVELDQYPGIRFRIESEERNNRVGAIPYGDPEIDLRTRARMFQDAKVIRREKGSLLVWLR